MTRGLSECSYMHGILRFQTECCQYSVESKLRNIPFSCAKQLSATGIFTEKGHIRNEQRVYTTCAQTECRNPITEYIIPFKFTILLAQSFAQCRAMQCEPSEDVHEFVCASLHLIRRTLSLSHTHTFAWWWARGITSEFTTSPRLLGGVV